VARFCPERLRRTWPLCPAISDVAKQSNWIVAGGYMIAAALMLAAAVVEAFLGIDPEGRSLEQIASPLSSK
jgi:hypothetical protein